MPEAVSTGPRASSLRRSGLHNIAISIVVAGSSYLALTLVARRFGSSIGSDAYFFLLSFSTITSGLISSVYATVFLPIFIDVRVKSGDDAAAGFAGSLLGWTLVVVCPIALCSYVFYDRFFGLVTQYDAAQLAQVRPVLGCFAAVFLLSVLSEFYRVLVLALGHFTLAAIGALFQPVLLICASTLLAGRLQEQGLAFALAAAKALLLALMAAVVVRRWAAPVRINLRGGPLMRRFAIVASPYAAATLVTNFAVFFFDYLATGLGAGVLSAIAYAQRVFQLPSTLILNPLLEIARTRFAHFRALDDKAGFLRQHNQLVQFILYFSIPTASVFYFFPAEIIASMFQRGAFGPDSVNLTAECLRILSPSIPFACLFMLNGRATESFQRLVWPSVFGTLGNLLVIFATHALVDRTGWRGIPLAKVCMDIGYFFPFGFIALQLFTGGIRLQHVLAALGIALLAALVPGLVYRWSGLASVLAPHFPSLFSLALLLGGFAICYLAIVSAFDRRGVTALRRAVHR